MTWLNYDTWIRYCIWAAIWQTKQSDCAPNEDSDQRGHPPSLISVFAVRMKNPWFLSYPLSAQRSLWSDWSESSLGAHSFCWFCHVAVHIVEWEIWKLRNLINLFRYNHSEVYLDENNKITSCCKFWKMTRVFHGRRAVLNIRGAVWGGVQTLVNLGLLRAMRGWPHVCQNYWRAWPSCPLFLCLCFLICQFCMWHSVPLVASTTLVCKYCTFI